MQYQVIARKWRPQKFDDVVGQPAVTRTLRNAIASDRLAQSFVFAGPRGVGKTDDCSDSGVRLQMPPERADRGSMRGMRRVQGNRRCAQHRRPEIDAATHTGIDNIQ